MSRFLRLASTTLLTGALALPLAARAVQAEAPLLDSETFAGLEPRPLGPGVTSGRITSIAGVPGDRLTLYVGSAGGGVWKSSDGGTSFKPIFDKYCPSIGAIAVDPKRPKVVWVGSGESWVRNSVSAGDGLYRSRDGGDSWDKVGLAESEHIAAIAIDPQHTDTVYVAALGHLWSSGGERGVYRTRDGGKTWERVLFVDQNTGCADIAVDPNDPRIVYAAMWQFRRLPWSFNSGGPGSGLYRSNDGGATWTRLGQGLPEGVLGRIAIAIAPTRPGRVWVTVEAKKGALLRSEDHGDHWATLNDGTNIISRPFYFARLVADPKDPNKLYKPGFGLSASDDGGATFSGIAQSTHGDHHALWIHPEHPAEMFLGTDGGVYESEDAGNHWRFLGGIPVGQFYHVSGDGAWPYNVYGGLQDNGTWMAPSHHGDGIAARHWQNIGGGDGFWAFPDPSDEDYVYVEYQGGNLSRYRRSIGESKDIPPLRREGEPELRFNWNSPIHVSETRPGTIYYGAQFLFRSRDRGEAWERISPDLSTNDPAKLKQGESGGLSVDNSSAENHCTIFTICESPKNADLIWVGTDDGNVQITRDAGKSWTNLTKNVAGLPKCTWVSRIEASHFDEGTAYATFDGHATGDMKTYVYRTTDFGKSWTALATPEVDGYAHVIREDRVNRDLLFLGTENGLWISVSRGKQWARLTGGFPHVAVRDLWVHPREGDLLIATHGRGLWILDDLSPLRALTPEVMAKDVAFLPARPSPMFLPSGEQRFDGDADYEGQARPEAALIHYWLKKRHLIGPLRVEIHDASGALVSSFPGGKRRGINRVEWPMRMKPPKTPPSTNLIPQPYAFLGPRVLPGTYTVKLVKDTLTLASSVELVPDPRENYAAEDRAMQHETVTRLYDMLGELTWLGDAVIDLQRQTSERLAALQLSDPALRTVREFSGRLDALRKTLSATREGGRLTGELQLRERLGSLYGSVNGFDGRPTRSQLDYVQVMRHQLDEATRSFEELRSKGLEGVNAALSRQKLPPLAAPPTHDEWAKRQEGE